MKSRKYEKPNGHYYNNQNFVGQTKFLFVWPPFFAQDYYGII